MDPSTYTIPTAYTPVIKHFFKKGEFPYLRFDGKNFLLPYTRMKVFLEDLREKLPKGEIALGTIDRAIDLWEKAMPSILKGSMDPDVDLSEAQRKMPMDRIKAIISGDEQIPDFGIPQKGREIGEGIAEGLKKVDWDQVAKVILVILVALFVVAIVIVIACAVQGDIDLSGLLNGISPGGGGGWGIGGKKEEEVQRRVLD